MADRLRALGIALGFMLVAAQAMAQQIVDQEDLGGIGSNAQQRADANAAAGVSETVVGKCMSACTYRTRNPRFCAMPSTELWFHGSSAGPQWTPAVMAAYPPRIQQWIVSKGGLASHEHWLVLKGEELMRLVRPCPRAFR